MKILITLTIIELKKIGKRRIINVKETREEKECPIYNNIWRCKWDTDKKINV